MRNSPQDLKEFDVSKGGYETTKKYCPPELILDEDEEERKVDLNLALVYNCGVLINEV